MPGNDDETRLMPTPFVSLTSIQAQTRQAEQATPLIVVPSSAPTVGVSGAGETYFGDTVFGAFPESELAPAADYGAKSKTSLPLAQVLASAKLTHRAPSTRPSALLDLLRAAQKRVVLSKQLRTTKVALAAVGFLLGVPLAVALSPDGSASKVDTVDDAVQVPAAPGSSNPLPVTDPGVVVNQDKPLPVTLYALTGKPAAKAREALLFTVSGKYEQALALYRELLSEDEGNVRLYVPIISELERRRGKGKNQP